ncbi:MAG TPA: cell division protein SepF [Clostridia bacterium]|nr:cell division protein SepF [Clostridia bacterium]
MKIVDKVLNLIGYEIEEEPSEPAAPGAEQEELEPKSRRANLVGLPTAAKPMRMAVSKPTKFEQVQVIADHLKNRHPVVVNVEAMELEMARRVVDFLSGTVYALNGSMQKVSPGIILFLPNNVEVTGDLTGDWDDEENVWSLKLS